MRPRPLLCWKSTWFGLLFVGFLGWAWFVSLDSLSGVASPTSSGWLFFGQFEGQICLASDVDISPYGARKSVAFIYEYGTGGGSYGSWWDKITPYGLVVPHWLLAAAFVMPWLSWLALRERRFEKLSRENQSS